MADHKLRSSAAQKFGESLSRELRSIKSLRESKQQDVGDFTDQRYEDAVPEIKVRELSNHYGPSDTYEITITRTSDTSLITGSREASVSSSQAKQKLMNLAVERSKTTPDDYNGNSLIKLYPVELSVPNSENQSTYSGGAAGNENNSRKSSILSTSNPNNPPYQLSVSSNYERATILPSPELKSASLANQTHSQEKKDFSKRPTTNSHNLEKQLGRNSKLHSRTSSMSSPIRDRAIQQGFESKKYEGKNYRVQNSPINVKPRESYVNSSYLGSNYSPQILYDPRNRATTNSSFPRHENSIQFDGYQGIMSEKDISMASFRKTNESFGIGTTNTEILDTDLSPFGKQTQRQQDQSLQLAIKRLNIKTFLSIRSIMRPHPSLQRATNALLCLISGLSDLVPKSIIQKETLDWAEAKVYLQSPIFLVNQLTKFKDFCDNGLINPASIARANSLLSKYYNPEDAYSSEILDTIEQFVRSAVEYFLNTHTAYSYENLYQFDQLMAKSNLNETTEANQKVSRPSSPASIIKTASSKSRAHSPVNHDNLSTNRPKSTVVRSKTPNNLKSKHFSTNALLKQQEPRLGTPTREMSNSQRSLSTKNIRSLSPLGQVRPLSPLSQKSSSNSPKAQRSSYSGNYKIVRPQSKINKQKAAQTKPIPNPSQNQYKYVKSRYMDVPTKKLQERNQAILNLSYGDYNDIAEYRRTKATKIQNTSMENKFKQNSEQKSPSPTHTRQRSLNTITATSFERSSVNNQQTQQINTEFEIQTNKKAAREFKQKATKLLADHDRMRKAEASAQETQKVEIDREVAKIEREHVEHFLKGREKEERIYDLNMYKDKQLFRTTEKAIKKSKENGDLHHELRHNLNSHYMKVELDAEKNSIKQRILRERLVQKHKDRVYRKQMDWIEKDERAREMKYQRPKQAFWKKLEDLNDRINSGEAYYNRIKNLEA